MLKNEKPNIFLYSDMIEYLNDLYSWKKQNDKSFSLRQATKDTVRCSPALVSLVLQRKRVLSPERASDFAKVFSLSEREKAFFKNVTQKSEQQVQAYFQLHSNNNQNNSQENSKRSNHILSHWLHAYVKDSARLQGFSPIPHVVHRLLRGIASLRSISRSLAFLIREGYLRYTLDGKLVEQTTLHETTDEIPCEKIRTAHKKALAIASKGIDSVSFGQREACTFLLPLNHEHFLTLKNRIKEWSDEVAAMAEVFPHDNETLYQLVIHLTPVGGLESLEVKLKENI